MILELSIKELTSYYSENNPLALKTITTLFEYIPITHQRCIEECWKGKEKQHDYATSLFGLKNTNENEFFYHEVCNNMESRVVNIMEKILANLEHKDKNFDDLSINIEQFADNLCLMSTDELFDIVLQQFASFLIGEPHPNSILEINSFMKSFMLRSPEKLSRKVLPFILKTLVVREEEEPKIWDTKLGNYFKETDPEVYKLAIHHTINKYLPKEQLRFYCTILGNLFQYDENIFIKNGKEIEELIYLFLLSNNKHNRKIGGVLANNIISAFTNYAYHLKPLVELESWNSNEKKLNFYKKVGQYEHSYIKSESRKVTKEGLVIVRNMLNKYCFGIHKIILGQTDSEKDMITWLYIFVDILPICISFIHKEGKNIFTLNETLVNRICGNDLDLLGFFKNLRVNLIKNLNSLLALIKPNLKVNSNQKFPGLILKCILSLHPAFPNLTQYQDFKSNAKANINQLKDPTQKDRARSPSYNFAKMSNLCTFPSQVFERKNEIVFPELEELVHNLIDLLAFTPHIVSKN